MIVDSEGRIDSRGSDMLDLARPCFEHCGMKEDDIDRFKLGHYLVRNSLLVIILHYSLILRGIVSRLPCYRIPVLCQLSCLE